MASEFDAKRPKGILKKTSAHALTPPNLEPFKSSLATVTTYAEQDEEARIMATFPVIELLTALPQDHAPQLTAAQPSERDAKLFKTEVSKLTRSEFGDLVEERNCEGRCGYALCPLGKRNFRNAFKIWKGDIASTENLNKWCSDACARRALNVQLQLGVVPTYGIAAAKPVELLGEESKETQTNDTQKPKLPMEPSMSSKSIDSKRQTAGDFQEDVVVIEKEVTKLPVAPIRNNDSTLNCHLMMEGHKTNFGTVSASGLMEKDEPVQKA